MVPYGSFLISYCALAVHGQGVWLVTSFSMQTANLIILVIKRRFDACGNSASSAHLNKLTQSGQRYPFFSLKGKYFDFEVIQTTATAESHFRNTWLDQAHLVGMCDKAKVPPHQEHLSTVFKCNIPVSQLSGDGRVLNVICMPFKGTVWKGTYWKSCWKQKWKHVHEETFYKFLVKYMDDNLVLCCLILQTGICYHIILIKNHIVFYCLLHFIILSYLPTASNEC